jgi:hypothetical protein
VGVVGLLLTIFFGIYSIWPNRSNYAGVQAFVPSVEGVLPLHLWAKRPSPETGNQFTEHRLGLIVKIHNKSGHDWVTNFVILEGCVGIDPMVAETMLPPSDRLPSGTNISAFFTRHQHTLQGIRVSGLVRKDSQSIPAGGIGYLGILFPFPAGRTGALLGVPGSISLEGDCKAIQSPSSQPSVSQIFKIGPIHRSRPLDLAEEIRSGKVRLSLSIAGTAASVDPALIRGLVSIRWERWQNLALSQMYEVPDVDYPPTMDD